VPAPGNYVAAARLWSCCIVAKHAIEMECFLFFRRIAGLLMLNTGDASFGLHDVSGRFPRDDYQVTAVQLTLEYTLKE
jgi:hypothetical protein